mmetsp:Transcript_18246/g.57780  ORF Transcript_18246/g.57780 Transcript_18246/m.57780 type:complete len:206 (+) Transcript_18246:425-1042(+)
MSHCRTGGALGARCQMYHTASRPGSMKPQAVGTPHYMSARELRACRRPHTHCRSIFHILAHRRSIPHPYITCPLLEIVKAGVKSFPKCLFLLLDVGRLANAALAQGAAGLLLLLQLYNREPSTVRAAARRHGRLYALRYLFGDALLGSIVLSQCCPMSSRLDIMISFLQLLLITPGRPLPLPDSIRLLLVAALRHRPWGLHAGPS